MTNYLIAEEQVSAVISEDVVVAAVAADKVVAGLAVDLIAAVWSRGGSIWRMRGSQWLEAKR